MFAESTACLLSPSLLLATLLQAQSVPTDVQLPGTQPLDVPELESPNKCDNCHAGYDAAVEPTFNWFGSMMAQATRDPLFWATVAIAEQDFAGAGDLCIRCHSTQGWLGGRSTPTDGAGLKETDATGVMCDACHQMTNPDDSEHLGFQVPPFLANDEGTPPEGYHGSGMAVFYTGQEKLGPYVDPSSPHSSLQSAFHRSSDMCGTCHDVSNPVVGDLAPFNGAQVPLQPGTFSGVPGSPVGGKAAFNNFPFQYGVVERTFSEHRASLLSETLVSDYASLPPELRAGAIRLARDAAVAAGPGGNYADGTPRTFSCQSCHMAPVTGKGCNKPSAPVRSDLPLHDLTGGNTWTPEAIRYLDASDRLVLGGGLDAGDLAALDAGAQRAAGMLENAASLPVDGDVVRVVNLTGHKLISGFPEGRRMWLNVTWFDASGAVVREDGEYGSLAVVLDGQPLQVDTILDLGDPHLRIWDAHFGLTQEWAASLVALGVPASLPLAFDRMTGAVDATLGEVAAQAPGTAHESFHFVLNDTILRDTRIPPYGMRVDEAVLRNVLPVPATQYGAPGPGGVYEHWDEVVLDPPSGAVEASIELLYQPTSWEYVQFLHLANTGAVAFLGETGADLLDAWLATGMAAPHAMATATWESGGRDCNGNGVPDPQDLSGGSSLDCNANGIPDECDIASGRSTDAFGAFELGPGGWLLPTGNGVPDECESPPYQVPLPVRGLPAPRPRARL